MPDLSAPAAPPQTPAQLAAAAAAQKQIADQATIERRVADAGLSVARQRGAVDAGPLGLGMRDALAAGKVAKLSDGVYSYNGADGVRNLVGAGAGAGAGNDTAGAVRGDPNSEYNRQVRDGMIAGSDGRKAQYQGGARGAVLARASMDGEGTGVRRGFQPAGVTAMQEAQLRADVQREATGAQYAVGAEGNRVNEDNNIRTNDTTRYNNNRVLSQNMRQMEWDRTKFGVDQANKQREMSLNEDKYGHQQDQDADASSIAANKALHEGVLNSLPPVQGKNGPEPDTAGAAAYMVGANKAIAERVAELRKSGNTRDADSLERRGPAALGAQDKQELTTGPGGDEALA